MFAESPDFRFDEHVLGNAAQLEGLDFVWFGGSLQQGLIWDLRVTFRPKNMFC